MDYEKDPGWQYLRRSREQMLADQSRPYDSKKNVWVPDAEEGYVEGEITSTKGDMVTVAIAHGQEKQLKKDLVQEMNPPKFEKTEDMSNLTFLNDASVLYNLRARYASMLIYTYSGLFCVVINPYKRLPIYTDSVARMFMGKRRTEMPPHLFAVSDEAYRNMLQHHENQSMLITGESGAGKTENTKKVIAYFASVGASQQEQASAGKPKVDEKKVTLEDQIVQTNPVLEAFGNAKTVRNNNSSRFGKFIRIHFSKHGRVASCDIEHYLLEKSRVIRQAPGERCYHIFYQVFSGFIPTLTKDLLLDKPIKDYWFVAQAELTIDGVNDKEEHQLTDEAFDILHFSPEEKKNCYKLVAAMMHMGNMKFKQRPREEQAEPDGIEDADRASKMYGVEVEDFLKALTRPRVKVGNEWVNKGQNLEQVNWAVGAMAKGLYSRIFNWLVKKCNQTLDQKGINRDYFIGVLDIAGFEIFDFNSFEQLWINFVNEKLQQFFNHHMFVLEQEEYAREGIQWTFIDFGLDLQACIELIEKPLGIISMLDEECIVPKATDMTLAQKLVEQHLGKHPNFEKPKPPKGKQAEAHFAMRHYAGTVRYNVLNWLEKNKDPLNDTVVSVMKASKSNELLKEVWSDYTTQEEAAVKAKTSGGGKKKGKSGSFMTVSMLYRESLNNLMSMLHKTHPHFIRCIIPNEKKASGVIDAALVLNQLTCNGVLEGIRICRKGFPNRTLHPDFVHRYAILAAKEAKSSEDPKECAKAILEKLQKKKKLKEEQYRIGHTKVFFKAGVVAHMEDLRDERLSELITAFQAQMKWHFQQFEFKRRQEQQKGLLVIQKNIRSWCMLRTWTWFKLYGRVKPLLQAGKEAEEMEKLQAEFAEIKENLAREEEARKALEENNAKLASEKAELLAQLDNSKGSHREVEERMSKLNSEKAHLEKSLADVNDRLADQEQATADTQRAKKKVEHECDNLKKNIQDLDLSLKKSESEKQSKEHQIRSLQDEMNQQDLAIAKLNKEKKSQEEANRKLNEDLQAEEEKNAAANRLRTKLQQSIDDLENNVEREKRQRADTEKSKRKVEGELKIAQETIDEITKQRQDAQSSLKKKEADLHAISVRLEDEQALVSKLQRNLKENDARLKELEDELENERQARSRAERAKNEIQAELEDLHDQLEEQGGATAAQIEINKKKDAELAKLRRDIEEAHMNHENQLATLKKKSNDSVAELSDQIDQVQKIKAKVDKEKNALQRQLEDANMALDEESKSRADFEKRAKMLEVQLVELRLKSEEQNRQIQEQTLFKGRIQNENGDLARQLEDLEAQLNAMSRVKAQYMSQLDEAKRSVADETRENQSLNLLNKNLQHEIDQLHESIEDEISGKNDLMRQLSKAQAEIQQWRAKFEGEGLVGADEMEDMRRKQQSQLVDLQAQLDEANSRVSALEKQKARLTSEAEAARTDAEIHAANVQQLEKKQKAFDRVVEEWRKKVDDVSNELDAAQRDSRSHSAEAYRLRGVQDSLSEQVEALRRENKALGQEVKDLTDQLTDGGRNVNELQKHLRRVEVEKEELQHALDEAEAALEAEESKVLRSQVEVSQIRAEIEKRIQEKEEEFENTRKNHQRAMESIQASLESETRGKADLLRIKKKLESDINDLEIALDHANKANTDAQKNIKRYLEQVKELQTQIEEEQRQREEFREQYLITEKKLVVAKTEQEDLLTNLESLQRIRKQLENELNDLHHQNNDLSANNSNLSAIKAKLESETGLLRADLDEALAEITGTDERLKRSMLDASRMAEELKAEQEHSQHLDRVRKGLELQVKEMQAKIEEAEAAVLKGGQKTIAKLEQRLKTIEAELEGEQRRHSEAVKNLSRQDRKTRELQFQVDEEKKNYNKMCELVEKLQSKLKIQRRQIEEAEEVANVNLTKYRQIQLALDSAEERAESAENSLVRLRSRTRITKSDTAPISN
ncbi:hypothetical protein QR680_016341 [Steinernema hermaphroditum]|uniref:Myosin motor domain-containing protein n=1 Tax=Steinernema hermaphroditum TaxID=289476 RepID=A0AA39LLU9_9BILA|nr:hypothetical protein QR680_016341 [Steinernema hermaphroditum]